jgi:hypothetical protein
MHKQELQLPQSQSHQSSDLPSLVPYHAFQPPYPFSLPTARVSIAPAHGLAVAQPGNTGG